MSRAAVDIETTGLVKGKDEIIEIAILPFDNDFKVMGRFVTFIKPLRGINPEALKVNGITEAMLAGAPTPLQVRSAFIDWKTNILGEEKIELLGQNVCGFDRPFLDYFFTPEVSNELFSHRADDTMVLARALKGAGIICPKGTGLKDLIDYFSIVINDSHRAYDDALAALQIWQKMIALLKK